MKLKSPLAIFLLTLAAVLCAQNPPAKRPAKTPSPPTASESASEKKIESYVRKLYAWGPGFRIKVGPAKPSAVTGFDEVPIEVTKGQDSDTAIFYVSKDGRFLLRGDIQDMSVDPFAAVRSRLHTNDSPSIGPPNARVVVIEFGDFECPSCKQLHDSLRDLLPNYPQVRFVFKNFPLTQVHPWAMTAAIAGRCAFTAQPESFWKLYDLVFDHQDTVNPGNVWQTMVDYAGQSGLDQSAFKSCMADPAAKNAVQRDAEEGLNLKIANTPTVFINGRRLVGGERGALEQYIQYELLPPR